jgi:hypothetical protein
MELYFSDYFELDPDVLEQYGAFDISIVSDLPLFIDPFLLFNSVKPEYQELHDGIRDVTFAEDLSQVRVGSSPQVMASLRNLVISLHRLAGATNIAKALRHHGRNPLRPLQLLKII